MQKLKIATLSVERNKALDWEPSGKVDFGDDMYQRRKKQEWNWERLPQGKAVLKTAFAIRRKKQPQGMQNKSLQISSLWKKACLGIRAVHHTTLHHALKMQLGSTLGAVLKSQHQQSSFKPCMLHGDGRCVSRTSGSWYQFQILAAYM